MATEALKVNNVFREGMFRLYPVIHWQRIECWTDKGVPDVNFCLQGREYWVECKWVPTKSGKVFSHKLQPEQCAWLLARSRAEGSAWVLARRGDVFRLYPGREARSLVDQGWNGRYLHEMEKPWEWNMIFQVMQG